jgi:phage anti-repressor protein
LSEAINALLTKLGTSGDDMDLFPLLSAMAQEIDMLWKNIKTLQARNYKLVRSDEKEKV